MIYQDEQVTVVKGDRKSVLAVFRGEEYFQHKMPYTPVT